MIYNDYSTNPSHGPTDQTINQSYQCHHQISQPIIGPNTSTDQSTNQQNNQPTNQPTIQLTNQPINLSGADSALHEKHDLQRLSDQPIAWTDRPRINQSYQCHHEISQPINGPNTSTEHIDRPTNQPNNQTTNRPTNQPTNQPTIKFVRC